jgi:hypothetical protein
LIAGREDIDQPAALVGIQRFANGSLARKSQCERLKDTPPSTDLAKPFTRAPASSRPCRADALQAARFAKRPNRSAYGQLRFLQALSQIRYGKIRIVRQ